MYVGLEDIESGGGILGARRVDPGDLASTKFSFTESHVLYGKLRPYLAKIAAPDFAGICSTDIVPVLPGPLLDRRYLLHFLRQPTMVAFASARSVGINLPRLSPSVLETFPVPLPPIPEQRRIAAILDQADALRAKRSVALAELDELVEAMFLKAHEQAGEPHRSVTLLDVAPSGSGMFVNGPFGSNLLTSELREEGAPVIYIRDIREGEYRRVSTAYVSPQKASALAVCSVVPGDVLVAKVGDPPGVAAIYPPGEAPGIVTQDVIRIRVSMEVATPEYIAAYLNSSWGKHKIAGITIQATRARFALGQFKQLAVELPSVAVQRRFAQELARIDALRTKQRESDTELDGLFASLQHRAFQGEL
jgi:type I restriction enzyme S subunit